MVNRKRKESVVIAVSGRLDSAVALSSSIPRSVFSLDSVSIILNGRKAKKSTKVKEGDVADIEWTEEVFEGIEAEEIPLSVLFEDDSILVIDKAQGMVVHPGAGVHSGTLVNALVSRYGDDFASSDDERPGIVHRLDKDTSGVMVIARTPQALEELQKEFAEHSAEKHYLAVVKGMLPEMHGFVDMNIERDPGDRKKYRATETTRGKSALTEYSVLKILGSYTLVDVRLHTGRTHQIRVHMKAIGHPILGDPIYGVNDSRFPGATLMLHSHTLEITHPLTGERMKFESPLPDRFTRVLESAESLK